MLEQDSFIPLINYNSYGFGANKAAQTPKNDENHADQIVKNNMMHAISVYHMEHVIKTGRIRQE